MSGKPHPGGVTALLNISDHLVILGESIGRRRALICSETEQLKKEVEIFRKGNGNCWSYLKEWTLQQTEMRDGKNESPGYFLKSEGKRGFFDMWNLRIRKHHEHSAGV